jgi:hypothetical protein
MGAPFQRLWHHILHLPFVRFLAGCFSEIAYQFGHRSGRVVRELEDGHGPTAQEIQATEQERAEQFKRDQLLPIMGMAGPPGW